LFTPKKEMGKNPPFYKIIVPSFDRLKRPYRFSVFSKEKDSTCASQHLNPEVSRRMPYSAPVASPR